MKRVRITLKNYRCFSDEEPARIEVGPGFTSLVGRNNSGKSAVKLFFFEFRNLFEVLAQPFNTNPSLADAFVENWRHNINYLGVSDPVEIFNNANKRPISIELEVIDPKIYIQPRQPNFSYYALAKVVATADRSSPFQWRFTCFGTDGRLLVNKGAKPRALGDSALPLSDKVVDCTDFLSVMRSLAKARYYGAFRNAINEGSGKHYDLSVGTAFIELWDSWKTGGNKAQMEAIDQVTDDIRRLFEFERLEINASNKLKTLMVSVDGRPHRLNELGSGLAQFIIVLGNAATNPPSLLLIDEPETNLHPALQIDLLLALGRHAEEGVIFSTHSVGLARSVAQPIYSVQRVGKRTAVKLFEETPNYLEFIGELSFSTFKELGSDRILLVEGVNDVKAVQQLLRLMHEEHRTVILPLGGNQLASGDRDAELEQLTRLSDHIYALVDSERIGEGQLPSPERSQFKQTCGKLGIDVCVTERRAIENYFTERAIKAALGDSFKALAPFQLLREAANPWSKAENWKIARQMELSELAGTDIGDFLERLSSKHK